MGTVDWGALTRFVPEVALAVIFGIFVLRLLERQDKRDAERDRYFIETLEKRDTEWRTFMRDEDERHDSELERLTTEVRNVATLVSATNVLVAQHDIWERDVARRAAATPPNA